jgi:Ca2+-binding RTX toxin-like protein
MTAVDLTLDLSVNVTLSAGSVTAADLDTVETNTTQDINMTAVTDVTLSGGESVSFDSSTVTGETFNLNGAGDNGGESFIVNLAPGGQTVDLSGITVDSNDVTVTINGNSGNDNITGTSSNDVIVTNGGSDTVIFANSATNNGADTISDFLSASDKLDFSAFETAGSTVAASGALTTTAGTVYYLTGAAAGEADSAAAVATALSAAATWTDADATAWVLVSDDNSAAVYEWADSAVSADGVASGELTLVGTITGTVAAGDLII